MNIEEERKAFESQECVKALLKFTGFSIESNRYYIQKNGLSQSGIEWLNGGWQMWQAATKRAEEKLEGCVVVPVQCPDPDFADSLFDELSKKAIGEFGDDLLIHFSDIDEEKIWALMVEAAKAQAVPEGFILVSKTPSLKVIDRLYAEHDIDEERATYIYRDIINAQEPTNDL